MNEIIWKDYDTSTVLYINGKRHATIYPQNIPGSKPEQKRYVMDLHYCNHNLHAESMEQAKNATLMLVLRDMEFHYKEYKQKAEDLHDAIRAINTTARFSQSDIVFEDIVIDTDTFDDLTDAQFECVINQVTYEMRRQMDKYGYEQYDALDRAVSIVKAMDLTPLYERCAAPENDGSCQHLSIEPEADNTVPAGTTGEQPKEYWMWLHYGWEESVDDGIRHAFEASDPGDDYDDEGVEQSLLSELAPDEGGNFNFDWDITMLKLPESLVKRIQADAVKERGLK